MKVSESMSALTRFRHSYYILNFLSMAMYLATRYHYVKNFNGAYSRLQGPEELLKWEKQSFAGCLVVLLVKFYRRTSLDGFFSDLFFYGKLCVALLALMCDMRFFVYYCLLYLILFVVLPQPVYVGPNLMEALTPASFKTLVKDAKGSDTTWLVAFYATWSGPCIHLEPVLAELSLKYTVPGKLQFGKLDLGRWQSTAPEVKVSLNMTTDQLPTLILFERGKEVFRMPHMFANGSVVKGRFGRTEIVKGFELDKRVSKAGTGKKGK